MSYTIPNNVGIYQDFPQFYVLGVVLITSQYQKRCYLVRVIKSHLFVFNLRGRLCGTHYRNKGSTDVRKVSVLNNNLQHFPIHIYSVRSSNHI